jgi:hypothetical protein
MVPTGLEVQQAQCPSGHGGKEKMPVLVPSWTMVAKTMVSVLNDPCISL